MIQLTEIERADLRQRQRKEKNNQLYIRITVLLMLDNHFSIPQIERSLGIDQTTVNRYINSYKEVGLSKYLTLNYVGYEGKLTTTELEQLDKELQDYVYINTYEVISFIKTQFGKTYTSSGVSVLLHRLGFTYKKTKHEPSKADTAKQTAFLSEMTAILDEIEYNSESSVAYFVDAVHPQHNTRSDYAWIKKGQECAILANAGRKRLNINGALNPHDVTDVSIDEADRIDQESMKRLIIKLVDKNPFKDIYLFHDNARYYYAKELREWIAQNHPSVKQIFLPRWGTVFPKTPHKPPTTNGGAGFGFLTTSVGNTY
jgi:transposase